MRRHRTIVLFCLALATLPALGAEDAANAAAGTDELYAQARTYAFDGRRVEARSLLATVLERSPDYYEVRVFLGRVYAWDKEWDNARSSLQRVLAARPDHLDARAAMVDVELWSGNYEDAVRQADLGLGHAPGNPDLLAGKARALARLGRNHEAADSAGLALGADPGRSDLRRLYYRILDEITPNKVSVDYSVESFNDLDDDWHRSSLDYRRSTKAGSFIGRVNWAKQFGETGTQFEVDAYPGLLKKTYAYLNAGYSSSDIFPDWRFGGEVYHNFPRSWEGSLGLRHLDYGTSDVTIYTGTVAKYFGNWWVSFRPNYVPKDTSDSFSGGITARRFLRGRFEYVEVTARGGITRPDSSPTPEVRDELDATLRVEVRKRITEKLLFAGATGVRREDLESGTTRESWFLGIGLERLF